MPRVVRGLEGVAGTNVERGRNQVVGM